MTMKRIDRRTFLHHGIVLAATTPLALSLAPAGLLAQEDRSPSTGNLHGFTRSDAKVAIVRCRSYGPETRQALAKCFDLLGGISGLVKNKTVTVKLNLTGTDFSPFLGRPVGETFMTHPSTALSLGALLLAAGARRVRFVESTQSRSELASTLTLAGWDLTDFEALGPVEFENTRNLGRGKSYAHLPVPAGGRMFSAFELNHSYANTDVMISLAKLKTHLTAGVTLSMKNMFGLTPNSLYGAEAGNEEATEGRLPLHNPKGFEKIKLPGLKTDIASIDPTWRVPRIVVDICAARPIHLAIIDGVSAMSGGEGPWCGEAGPLKVTSPGVLIAGLNPVSTDAVGTAIMGFSDPRSPRGVKPFASCDNHLLMAEQAGLGSVELSQIDVRGTEISKVRYLYG